MFGAQSKGINPLALSKNTVRFRKSTVRFRKNVLRFPAQRFMFLYKCVNKGINPLAFNL